MLPPSGRAMQWGGLGLKMHRKAARFFAEALAASLEFCFTFEMTGIVAAAEPPSLGG